MKKSAKTALSLNLERLPRLTVNACKVRAKLLLSRVESGEYKGSLREKALQYASWYRCKAKQLKKAA